MNCLYYSQCLKCANPQVQRTDIIWAAIKVYKAKKVIEEANSPSSVSMADTPSETPLSPEWVDDWSLETQPEEVPPSPNQSLETLPNLCVDSF